MEASDIRELALNQAHISETQLGRIDVRDRFSFISVADEVADQVVERLSGLERDGITLRVEKARAPHPPSAGKPLKPTG